MEGCGNDFLILDYLGAELPRFYASEVRYLCDRHFGVGADGLVVIHGSETAHAAWKFYNSDGSEASMCGNAARCVIRYLAEKRFPEVEVISLETGAGIIRGRKLGPSTVEVTLLNSSDVKFDYEHLTLKTEKNVFEGYALNTGVPHLVLEVKDLATYPVVPVGSLLLKHPAFSPQQTNVTFFQRLVGAKILATTFERGVEKETFACGTGVAAAAIIFSELYLQPFPIEVQVPGGELTVDLSPASKMLLLQGPAEYVMSAEVYAVRHDFEPRHLFSEGKK